VGCHLGGTFLGAIGYADDVTLLSPSRQGLQIMLKIVKSLLLHIQCSSPLIQCPQKANLNAYFSQGVDLQMKSRMLSLMVTNFVVSLPPSILEITFLLS
jgi:hypothetical protein